MSGDGRRPRRVAEQVRAYLGQSLSSVLTDPRVASIVVTRVELGADLSVAYVYVRLLVGDGEPRRRKAAVGALAGAAPKLRRGLGQMLALKRVPELRFSYDTSPDKRARVDELLEEIASEGTRETTDDTAVAEDTGSADGVKAPDPAHRKQS